MLNNFWEKIPAPILALAPMAGFTDSPFRQLTASFGADVLYSEMASATALFYNQAADSDTLTLVRFQKKLEANYVVQLFGSVPEHFAAAARRVTTEIEPAGIDINFGCPVPKVLKQGAGAELMKNLKTAREVIEAVLANTSLPVSIKIRARAGEVTALDFLKNVSDLPLSAVMIHGRTLNQGFTGEIDYDLIKQARSYFSGKILANGGINDLNQAQRTLALTGADGLGLARGILGRPWLFTEIKNNQMINFTPREIFDLALRHARLVEQQKGEAGIIELRKHLVWYIQGLPQASRLRQQLVQVNNYDEIKNIFDQYDFND
jgi:nifR3 family TIM-barrel protein